jgi:hypothetical protein
VTDPIARNIVSQLGDLYMDFTHPATTDRAEFVKYRQATNDQADAFVEALLREYGALVLEEAANAWMRGEMGERTATCRPRPGADRFEALAADGGLLNSPDSDGCDHRWRTFRTRRDGLYGCCERCAQRCLACARGLNGSGPGRVTVCGTCGTDWRDAEVPSA